MSTLVTEIEAFKYYRSLKTIKGDLATVFLTEYLYLHPDTVGINLDYIDGSINCFLEVLTPTITKLSKNQRKAFIVSAIHLLIEYNATDVTKEVLQNHLNQLIHAI